jgi:hypothetical protein
MGNVRLNPQTHRLSDINGIRARGVCQRCGSCQTGTGSRGEVSAWLEHDHNDNPEYKFLFLCARCSDEIIEPHPRLYRQMDKYEPLPGAMEICGPCKWRKEIACTNPNAQVNGGRGLKMEYPKPAVAFVDGPKFRGRRLIYHGPVTACDGLLAEYRTR